MSHSLLNETVCSVAKRAIAEGGSQRFQVKVRGEVLQGFVVRRGGKFFAYLNQCQHLSVTLDLDDGKFFTHDKQHLQCHLHGAIYTIETGECIAGPCLGAFLVKLPLDEEEDRLVIHFPNSLTAK